MLIVETWLRWEPYERCDRSPVERWRSESDDFWRSDGDECSRSSSCIGERASFTGDGKSSRPALAIFRSALSCSSTSLRADSSTLDTPPCGPTIVNFTKKKLGSFFYARIKNPSHHKSRTWMRPGYLEAPSPATKPGNGRRQTAASPINTRLGRSFVVKGFHRSLVYVPMHSSLGSSRLQGLTWKCKYRSLCCSGRGCR